MSSELLGAMGIRVQQTAQDVKHLRNKGVWQRIFDRNYLDTVAIELRYPTYLRLKEKEPLNADDFLYTTQVDHTATASVKDQITADMSSELLGTHISGIRRQCNRPPRMSNTYAIKACGRGIMLPPTQ